MEDTYLLAEGLREEDRVGTGIDRLLESTSASLFERGTVFTKKKKPYNQSINQSMGSNNMKDNKQYKHDHCLSMTDTQHVKC